MNLIPIVESKTELETLADLINKHCDRTGESVTSLASRAGVRRPAVSQLKSGEYPGSPSLELVSKVAAAIRVKICFRRA